MRTLRTIANLVRLGVLIAAGIATPALGADWSDCGNPFVNHFGPFDYRTASPETKTLVESFHFTPEVEQLRPGAGTGYLGGDIGYTLHVFPNHPRALLAMSRLAVREKTAKPRSAKFTVDCYFARAIEYRPDDGEVYLIYGIHLLNTGNPKAAIEQMNKSATLLGDSRNVLYNLGLAHFQLKEYDEALSYAQRAYALGFPLPGLRQMLEKAGRWKEPASPVAVVPQASGTASP